jgi:CheY-like chemotaxis protein
MQAQRLEVVSRLTGGLAHDFNNLLQVLLGNAEILIDGLAENPRLRRWADMSKIAAERGAELTRRLMAFARRQMLEPSQVDANGLLMGMTDTLGHLLGDRQLTLDLAEDLWPAMVDRTQLESAIVSIAINARDAMPAGGNFVVTTANRELTEDDCIYEDELMPGRYIAIMLADNGVGMSAEVLKRCCEPFFTTKDVGAGSGLGLSMVYGFLKQSDGHLTIASAPGAGTTVSLYLPWAGVEKLPSEPSALLSPQVLPRGAETVVVVEDDPLVRRYVCQQVAAFGYAVIECADAAAALAVLRRGETADLLFSDILMPGGMDGIALAAEARRLRPGLKVLLTTGDAQGSAARTVDLAGEELLAKPYRREDLAAALRTALDKPPPASPA